VHAAEAHRLFKGGKEFRHREMVVPISLIRVRRPAGGQSSQSGFSVKAIPAAAVGKAIFQHQIAPLFLQRRATVPIKRMLKYDDVVVLQQLLLARNVDVKVWIRLVQIVERDAWQVPGRRRQRTIDPRFLDRGMGKKHKDAGGSRHSGRVLAGSANWQIVRRDIADVGIAGKPQIEGAEKLKGIFTFTSTGWPPRRGPLKTH
jgi:hypothetical protein